MTGPANNNPMHERLFNAVHHPVTAWVILLCSLVLTAAAWWISDYYVTERSHDRFQFRTDDITSSIERRMHKQEMALRAGTALFAASESVDRHEWRKFVEILDIKKNYPGLQGLGYSVVVPPQERSAFVQRVRAEGFPDFQIKPAGDRDFYTTIVYLEPFDKRNQRAFGYDMSTESVRRTALERARDTGGTAITGKVRLVQETETDVQSGFLMYTPTYRKGQPVATPAQRRLALQGYVYSPFRMNDLMQGILGERLQDVHFTIYDGTDIGDDALLYTSHDTKSGRNKESGSNDLRIERRIEINGHTWTLVFVPAPGFVSAAEEAQPIVVAFGGLLIDILLFLIIGSIARRHKAAEVLAHDMTEAYRAGTVRLQAVLDNVIDGIITINDRGLIESFNAAAERIFGYRADEVVGKNISMLMPEPYHSQHDGYLTRYKSGGAARVFGIGREVEGKRRDDTTFPMDLAVSELVLNDRRLFIGIVRDITDRKKNERLKSEFISTVSHELRTPLTSIRGSLGLIIGGVTGAISDKTRELLDIAYKNSERLSRLINDLLDIEKIETGSMKFNLQPHKLSALIEQSLIAYRGYGEQLRVQFVVTGKLPDVDVKVDTERFLQVMANLLSNAAKFSPPGNQVEIAARVENEQVHITVTDHGPGIPNEFRERVFQRFSQADSSDTRSKGGTGLGLSITKSILERMNGSIRFEPAPVRGTVFIVELPVSNRPAPPPEITPAQADLPRVLVCEDDPDVAQLIARMLTEAGMQADLAHSAAEARQALAARRYDAMTLDLVLPDADGVSLLQALRSDAATRNLPIVVVSGKADEGRASIHGSFGVVDWLAKPIDKYQLTFALDRAIHGTLGVRTRVLHVEDDPDIRRVVAALAGALADFDYAGTMEEARAKLGFEQYGLVILDINLPDGSGWELLPLLEKLDQPPPVMVFSGDTVAIDQAQQVASALIKSGTSNDDIVHTIRALLRPKAGRKPSTATHAGSL